MSPDTIAMRKRREQVLGPAYQLFYREPVHLVRGEGVWLYDADGQKYLDMYNNVPHVGHCHPRVVAALTEQIRLLNTHTRYLHGTVLDCAERLRSTFEDPLDTVMFTCTGSEANELALRVARTCTGHRGVIVTSHAYHGTTQATHELSTAEYPPEQTPPHIATVPVPDAYRGPYRGLDAAERYAEHVQRAIERLGERGLKPAALVIDTIVSCPGVVTPPPGYLARAAEIVRAAGGLFIADEVQPGFGRTGAHFWGYQADALIPDMVTLGKPMGNGHPVAAMVARRDLVARFARSASYFNTFAGNPVSCAAALAVLETIEREDLQRRARDVGRYLVTGLMRLAERHSTIGDVRGNGLFIALELVTDRERRTPATEFAADVVNGLRERGVLTGTVGPDKNILKLRPPMVITEMDADYLLQRLDDTLGNLQAHSPRR